MTMPWTLRTSSYQLFLVQKKDCSHHPVINLKPVHMETTLQDEGPTRVFPQSQKCIPFRFHYQWPLQVPPVYMEWPDLRVHLPTNWTLQCLLNFHEVTEANNGSSATKLIVYLGNIFQSKQQVWLLSYWDPTTTACFINRFWTLAIRPL